MVKRSTDDWNTVDYICMLSQLDSAIIFFFILTFNFSVFLQFFKDFGDIIKETMSKSKLISPVQSARTVCLSLQQVRTHMSITYLIISFLRSFIVCCDRPKPLMNE